MGYQRPKTPCFYVDMMSYLHATGHGEYFVRHDNDHSNNESDNKIYHGEISDLLYCNTSSSLKFNPTSSQTMWRFQDYATSKYFPVIPINFAMMLNHNLENTNVVFHFKEDNTHRIKTEDFQDKIINWGTGSTSTYEYNGFSLRQSNTTYLTSDTNVILAYFTNHSGNTGQRYVGSTILGHTYTPQQDPKVTMSREFDGISVSKTKGGFSHHNINYLGSPLWSGHNAWELWKYPIDPATAHPNENPDASQQPMFTQDNKANLGRLGRRKWTISFTHLAEYDLYAALEQTNWNSFDPADLYPESTVQFSTKGYENPILEEDNFMSRLWIPTLGGSIPFVFQPDDENNNPDQFAICTFDRHSISITPKAPNVYTITFNISEVW